MDFFFQYKNVVKCKKSNQKSTQQNMTSERLQKIPGTGYLHTYTQKKIYRKQLQNVSTVKQFELSSNIDSCSQIKETCEHIKIICCSTTS